MNGLFSLATWALITSELTPGLVAADGFVADVTVETRGLKAMGRLIVESNGRINLEGLPIPICDWAAQSIRRSLFPLREKTGWRTCTDDTRFRTIVTWQRGNGGALPHEIQIEERHGRAACVSRLQLTGHRPINSSFIGNSRIDAVHSRLWIAEED